MRPRKSFTKLAFIFSCEYKMRWLETNTDTEENLTKKYIYWEKKTFLPLDI